MNEASPYFAAIQDARLDIYTTQGKGLIELEWVLGVVATDDIESSGGGVVILSLPIEPDTQHRVLREDEIPAIIRTFIEDVDSRVSFGVDESNVTANLKKLLRAVIGDVIVDQINPPTQDEMEGGYL